MIFSAYSTQTHTHTHILKPYKFNNALLMWLCVHGSYIGRLTSALWNVSSSDHLGDFSSFRSGTDLTRHLSLLILIRSSWAQHTSSLISIKVRPNAATHYQTDGEWLKVRLNAINSIKHTITNTHKTQELLKGTAKLVVVWHNLFYLIAVVIWKIKIMFSKYINMI